MTEIIAEIGQNHNGDIELALEMVRQAKLNGADVAKFQLFDAKALFPKENNPWYEYNLKTELSFEQCLRIADECERCGIEFMASAFDPERVGWLEKLGVKRYKVASRSINDEALLKAFLDTGKPLIVSLGFWNEPEFPKLNGSNQVDFLYCISRYPTLLEDVHLSGIDFTKYSGFSDHTIGLTAPFAAMARGAKIIEKHFTLDQTLYGPDHESSMNPDELLQLSQWRDELKRCL
ncbi:N-acetylneuraminate synthase family protein [Calditrichota bacterium]